VKVRLTESRLAILRTLFVLAVPLVGEFGYIASYGLLFAWSLRGPRQTIESLLLAVFVSLLTPAFYVEFAPGVMARWGLLFFAAGLTLLRYRVRKHGMPAAVVWIALFMLVVAGLSLRNSYLADASLAKLVTFGVGALTTLLAVQQCRDKMESLTISLRSTLATIFVLSFPLIVTGAGYVRNGTGFQGLLSQPQAYAIILAPFVAWIGIQLYSGILRGYIWYGVLAISVLSLFQTHARTGVLAVCAGLLVGGFIHAMDRRKRGGKESNATLILSLSAALCALGAIAIFYEPLVAALQTFITKGGELDLRTSFERSRGILIVRSWENFLLAPMTGIGFGMPSDPGRLVITYIAGVPMFPSAEKGMLLVALLEEIGLIGMAFFVPLLASLFMPAIRVLNAPAAAFGIAAFATNFGESTFYSMGGIGVLLWVFMSYSAVVPAARSSARPASRPRLSWRGQSPANGGGSGIRSISRTSPKARTSVMDSPTSSAGAGCP
jgi:hypothetical protein